MNMLKHSAWFLIILFSAGGCYKNEPIPAADFIFMGNNEFHAPCDVVFTNRSVNAFSYEWAFGDDSVSTDTNPSHTYANAGTYYVALRAFTESRKEWSEMINEITILQAR
jgi:PKD repeat protein